MIHLKRILVPTDFSESASHALRYGVSFAREYKAGKPTGVLYAPVAMTGYVPDLLADVSMVADDFDITPGTCGKGWKEYVPNGAGGPHIRTRARLA